MRGSGCRSASRVSTGDAGGPCSTTRSGTVIEVAEQVDEKELPPPVAAAMHSHPRAIYVSGMKVTRGGGVQYQLTRARHPQDGHGREARRHGGELQVRAPYRRP